MNIKPIIDHFSSYLPLDETETKAIHERLIERLVKRRQFMLQEGDVCQYYALVVQGNRF